ncbi:hypothetical protein AGIG_G16931 [Arapaima gigas]
MQVASELRDPHSQPLLCFLNETHNTRSAASQRLTRKYNLCPAAPHAHRLCVEEPQKQVMLWCDVLHLPACEEVV